MKVGTWNAHATLGHEQNAAPALERIKELDCDVLMVTEACTADDELLVTDDLSKLGYTGLLIDREPLEERKNRMLLMLSRAGGDFGLLNLAHRRGIGLSLPEGLHIVGAHFDDRNESARLANAQAYTLRVPLEDGGQVLLGDLNGMHVADPIARRLRGTAARQLAHRIPIPRVQSVATRLLEMAEGTTMAHLAQAGLHDADPSFQPTFAAYGRAVAQLDHIMHTADLDVAGFTVHDRHPSDHMPITVDVRT